MVYEITLNHTERQGYVNSFLFSYLIRYIIIKLLNKIPFVSANGPFLYTLVQKFEEKLQNPTSGPKLTVYSAHDINVLGLLRTFGHNYRPTFSSSIYFELWKLEETSYINVYFKNGDWVYPLQINGCDFNCALNEFKNLMKNYIIDEQTFRKECFLDSDKSSSVSNCVVNESKKSLFENKGN